MSAGTAAAAAAAAADEDDADGGATAAGLAGAGAAAEVEAEGEAAATAALRAIGEGPVEAAADSAAGAPGATTPVPGGCAQSLFQSRPRTIGYCTRTGTDTTHRHNAQRT